MIKVIKMEVNFCSILVSVLTLGLVAFAIKVLNYVWFKPKKLERMFRQQGLNGNPYRFLFGDWSDLVSVTKKEKKRSIQFSEDLAFHILPFYHQSRTKYGDNAFMWFGPTPRLCITDPDLIKEILTRTDVYHKARPDPLGEAIVGGIVYLEDEKWAKHRRIINPAFHVEKLKNMEMAIRLSCSDMINKWENMFSAASDRTLPEIDVWPYLVCLSCDVISRTAFGSSYEEGRKIFELQQEYINLHLEHLHLTFVPGWSYMPTKTNKRMSKISKEMQSLLRGLIKKRQKAIKTGEFISDDLLSKLMESNQKEINEHGNKNKGMSIEEIIEECKVFYFAGSETTSVLLSWTMVMLSKYQEWQARARDEVLQVFGKSAPNFKDLHRLKIVTMILHEVLRLYPPAPLTTRAPVKTTKLGNITLPKQTPLMLAIGLLHHDLKIWGEDASEFKPERFSQGISNATTNKFSYVPFGAGPRICIGQNFAMTEAKMALAMILQRFTFELSPSYKHAPFPIITLRPEYGVPLMLNKQYS